MVLQGNFSIIIFHIHALNQKGLQGGHQVPVFPVELHLLSDVIAVPAYGVFAQSEMVGDFFGPKTLADQIGDFDFRTGNVRKLDGN